MEKVCEIFMEDDKKGLEELYKKTNDKLCKIALGWLDTYGEDLDNKYSNAFEMYDDIINYLWERYNIGGNNE